jgi:hypothetical protein
VQSGKVIEKTSHFANVLASGIEHVQRRTQGKGKVVGGHEG